MPAPSGPTDRTTDSFVGRPDGDRSHVLIESGCLREFAVHVLDRSETSSREIDVRPTAFEPRQPTEIVRQLPDYDQIAAVVGTHDASHLTAPWCTLTALVKIAGLRPAANQKSKISGNVAGSHPAANQKSETSGNVAKRAWELLAFEIVYPQRAVYLIFGRRIDCSLNSVMAIVDPRPDATEPDTAIIYDISTDRVDPFSVSLDTPLPPSDRCSEQRSTDVGSHVAIDWFVS